MTPDTCKHSTSPWGNHEQEILVAFAQAFSLPLEDFTPRTSAAVLSSFIALAYSDEEAAAQAGMSLEDLSHDRVSLDATDNYPLIVTANTSMGRFYFSRPPKGWPRPGHRRYS